MATTTESADALVLFGATGDLAHKKIFDALYDNTKRGHLKVPVIGVAGDDWTVERLCDRAREGIDTFGGGVNDEKSFDVLAKSLSYIGGDYRDPTTFTRFEGPPPDRSPRVGGNHVSNGGAAGKNPALVHRRVQA